MADKIEAIDPRIIATWRRALIALDDMKGMVTTLEQQDDHEIRVLVKEYRKRYTDILDELAALYTETEKSDRISRAD